MFWKFIYTLMSVVLGAWCGNPLWMVGLLCLPSDSSFL